MTSPRMILGILASGVVLVARAGEAGAQPSGSQARPVAVVNGEPIPMDELNAVLLSQLPPAPAAPTEVHRREMQREALDMLIDERLMLQFLRANGPKVDEAEVSRRRASLEASLKAQKHTLQEFLHETGQTEAQLLVTIRKTLQWNGYVQAHLTDAEVKRYYDDNRDFFDQVSVRASHIVLRMPAGAANSERQAARARLQALRQEILAGKIDFAEAAKKYSVCTSAAGGGDLGYFPRKWQVAEPFARVAFSLKVGEISDVVETEAGYHLIKVTDRKPGKPSNFAAIKDDVRENCSLEMMQNVIAQQRQAAKIEINLP